MNAKEANKISIVTYLDQLGISPSKVKAGYCLTMVINTSKRTGLFSGCSYPKLSIFEIRVNTRLDLTQK